MLGSPSTAAAEPYTGGAREVFAAPPGATMRPASRAGHRTAAAAPAAAAGRRPPAKQRSIAREWAGFSACLAPMPPYLAQTAGTRGSAGPPRCAGARRIQGVQAGAALRLGKLLRKWHSGGSHAARPARPAVGASPSPGARPAAAAHSPCLACHLRTPMSCLARPPGRRPHHPPTHRPLPPSRAALPPARVPVQRGGAGAQAQLEREPDVLHGRGVPRGCVPPAAG